MHQYFNTLRGNIPQNVSKPSRKIWRLKPATFWSQRLLVHPPACCRHICGTREKKKNQRETSRQTDRVSTTSGIAVDGIREPFLLPSTSAALRGEELI